MRDAHALALASFLVACGGRIETDGTSGSLSQARVSPQPGAPTVAIDAGANPVVASSGGTTSAGATSPAPAPGTVVGAVPGFVGAVAMDDLALYLGAQSGIYRLPKSGAGGAQLLAATDDYTDGIAVDDANVYWTDLCGTDPNCEAGAGLVYSAPKGGGARVALASGQFRPWNITVDDTNVYWTNEGEDLAGQPYGGGQVVSTPKAGGTPVVLVDGLQLAEELVLDGDGVIFHAFDTIGRVAKAGGAVTTLDKQQNGFFTTNLVVAGGQLYYVAGDGGGDVVKVATNADDTGPASAGPFGTVLATLPQPYPGALAISGDTLFWNVAGGDAPGQITRLDLADGAQSIFVPPDIPEGDFVSLLAVGLLADAKTLYEVQYQASDDGSQQTIVRAIPQ